jgi:glycosyltransferase involved in cell wall biosynthesis
MRILHLVPGSGGTFYCQNCLRDHLLIRALRRQGHEVMLAPLYLPMYAGEVAAETDAPLFFGGISVYVREKIPFLRNMPGWMDRLLNLPVALRYAAAREGSTNAAELGSMTLSMLDGPLGNQKQEFDRFVDWLLTQPKPDIIHLSNALLLGFVPALREKIDAVFVCTLQDEEPWVNAMRPPYDRLCWETMARRARDVAKFIATSRWYAQRMTERMALNSGQVCVVYPGVDIPSDPPAFFNAAPPTIGYLSRLHPEQGFEDIVNVFIQLKQSPELDTLRLRATGGATPADQSFLDRMEERLDDAGIMHDAEISGSFHAAPDASFFGGLTVMSAPARGGEAFGMHIIEAMARGIPVVQPNIGAYPEIIAEAGGGILYNPNDQDGLFNALRELLSHPDQARQLGEQGYAYARERFSVERMARDMIALYEKAMA